jgi:hypothetical protein
MRTILIAGVALAAIATPATAEMRGLSGFDSVSAAERVPVQVTMGAEYSVEVTGPDANRVRTRVDDGTLKIDQTEHGWFGDVPRIDANVRVTLPRIEGLSASRGAELDATDIRANHMDLSASMGGALTISGSCSSLDASASMGGSLDAENFQCNSADVSASMGGSAEIYAENTFDASASMGGSIDVAGNAAGRDISSTMGGSVSHR